MKRATLLIAVNHFGGPCSQPQATELAIDLQEQHFPFWSLGRLESVKLMKFFSKDAKGALQSDNPRGSADVVTREPDGTESKETVNDLTNISVPQPPDEFTLKLKLLPGNNAMNDLWLALAWAKKVELAMVGIASAE
jgi:hypothetical protein